MHTHPPIFIRVRYYGDGIYVGHVPAHKYLLMRNSSAGFESAAFAVASLVYGEAHTLRPATPDETEANEAAHPAKRVRAMETRWYVAAAIPPTRQD